MRITRHSLSLLLTLMAVSGIVTAQPVFEIDTLRTGVREPATVYATTRHLFLLETPANHLLMIDRSDGSIDTLGGLGTGNYQFDSPVDVDATNGLKIFISDSRNNRIQIYDRRFLHVGSIKGDRIPGGSIRIRPGQIAINDFGEIFIEDRETRSILAYDQNGAFLYRFALPEGVRKLDQMKVSRQQIELTDLGRSTIWLVSLNGIVIEQFPVSVSPETASLIGSCIQDSCFYVRDGTLLKVSGS